MSKKFRPNPNKIKPKLSCPACNAKHNHANFIPYPHDPAIGYWRCDSCSAEYIRPHRTI